MNYRKKIEKAYAIAQDARVVTQNVANLFGDGDFLAKSKERFEKLTPDEIRHEMALVVIRDLERGNK